MGPKPVMPQSGALFGYPLREHLNQKHPLIKLADLIDWQDIETVCSSSLCDTSLATCQGGACKSTGVSRSFCTNPSVSHA